MQAENVGVKGDCEFSVKEQRPRVYETYSNVTPRDDGFFDCIDADGELFISDEDGNTLGVPGFGEKERARRAKKRLDDASAHADSAARIRGSYADLGERARQLFAANHINYPDTKAVKSADGYVTKPDMTDENKIQVLDVLFGLDREVVKRKCKESEKEAARLLEGSKYKKAAADASRPHRDMFRGRIVDHNGILIDDHYPVTNWIKTLSAAQLKGEKANNARNLLKEWALDNEWNDLIERMNGTIPEWDGKPRMETKLIEMFQTHETPLNRSFGKYFWLSLYGRVMYPGIYAPMVLSLFGAQDCGKSYFGKRLAQIILGDRKADSVQLNLEGDKLSFLREITGQSVVASVGEMTGFTRGDLNKIKDFITRTSDPMHYKFEGNFDQQRQWIVIMDGNKYEGLQRDDTGNRRFYPMFCGQLPDESGQPRWRSDFSATFESEERGVSFTDDVWQLLAEAREWFDENGEEGYVTYAREVGRQVAEFSRKEMAAERGTVDDETVGPYIDAAVRKVSKLVITQPDKTTVIGIRRDDLFVAMDEIAGYKVSASRGFGIGLNKAMKARGGGDKTFLPIKIRVGNDWKRTTTPGYKFVGCANVEQFVKSLDARLGVTDEEHYLEAEIKEEF